MGMTYEELKRLAYEVRAGMVKRGEIDPARGKIRKKPRDKEKSDMLLAMAMNRAEKYKPEKDTDGKIILPYFAKP